MSGLLVALPLVAAYLIVAPPAADLAAATYRSDLFARVGFTTWDTGWYAAYGHWLPGYSLLSPALGALFGVRLLLALSVLAASVLFGLIAQRCFSQGAGRVAAGSRVAAGVFALGVSVGMLSGRVPFDLGVAIGLGAVLALLRGRLGLGLALAAVTSVSSPVAGAFLAMAGLALAIAGRPRWGLGLAAAALGPALVLSVAYPEGGYEPFAPSAFWPAFGAVLLIGALLPRGPLSRRAHLALRVGAGLYAAGLVAAFAIHTPMGGNAARLGPLLAPALLAGVLWDGAGAPGWLGGVRPRTALVAIAPVLLYWQLATPVRDLASIANDPSVHAAYYAPLRGELRRLDLQPAAAGLRPGEATVRPSAPTRSLIVEVPLTKAHWEAAYLAGHDGIRLARGWERQLDTRYAALFYRHAPGSGLSASAYERWLRENKVVYVALPDVPLDKAGAAEGALVASGVPYLREIWRSRHWRLYSFMG